jgi:hypothetical protein
VQPAPIDEVGVGRLDLGDQGREVLVVLVDTFKQRFLETFAVDGLARLLGQTLAIGRLVVHDRDLLALEIFDDVIARDRALLVVATAGAEDVPHVALGDLGIGGRRRNLEDAVLLIDLGGGNGDARVEMADDEFHAVADKLVGHRHAFLRVGAVVTDVELDLLSENAAGGVDILDRLLDAVLELRAEGGAAAGERAADAELDLRRSGVGGGKGKTEGEAKRKPWFHRGYLWMELKSPAISALCEPPLARDSIRKRSDCHPDFTRPWLSYRRGGASAAGRPAR